MKFTEARFGRVFILRLEHGDKIPDEIECFAKAEKISSALVNFLGGADTGSKVVVGPEDGTAEKPQKMITRLPGVSEAAAVGTLFLNEQGHPRLHMHSAFGRKTDTITGCTREGIDIWHIGEVVIIELLTDKAIRKVHPENGFELLEIEN